jgi:dTDP-4-dehydrorhamnose reductase
MDVERFCDLWDPDVIINLIGENSPDAVEKAPDQYWFQNVEIPLALKRWSDKRKRWIVHVSSQAVFGGEHAPYGTAIPNGDIDPPVNHYGKQKLATEKLMMMREHETMIYIVRLTFILGVRPWPNLGRANPLEQMYRSKLPTNRSLRPKQVADRWFSPCFANDAASFIWQLVGTFKPLDPLLDRFLTRKRVFNVGLPMKVSRADVAFTVVANLLHHEGRLPDLLAHQDVLLAVQHDKAFPDLAQRPIDTTFNSDAVHDETWDEALNVCTAEWRTRMDRQSEHDRALELSLFLGIREGEARVQLMRGFGALHGEVANDFRAARVRKQQWTDFDLLMWYKQTNAYLWELSAYHLDTGFNYTGMCTGISQHLLTEYGPGAGVVALGDGIGDLSISLAEHGLSPIYHDLLGSQTARFAVFRFNRRGLTPLLMLTDDWAPPKKPDETVSGKIKAVVALDFFEHLINVEDWAESVFELLDTGGQFLAQNAFGIGDDEHEGSIPMHLTRNNKYVTEWEPLLTRIGFTKLPSGWWAKP